MDDPDRPARTGTSPPRREDPRLLTGQGQFTADLLPVGHYHAVVVRSPHAHAHIRNIETAIALAQKDVLAVLTGHDAAEDGINAIAYEPDWIGPPDAPLQVPADFTVFQSEAPLLAVDTVRYVGEPVALVVAGTLAAAMDAAEAVEIDYGPLPAVTDARAAMAADAAQVWPDCAGNVALTCEVGDKRATDSAFARAAHVVEFDSWIQRVIGNPMEPRAVVGYFDREGGRYCLHTASGRGAVRTNERLALTLGVPKDRCQVIFGDMGGNFGTRNAFYPEYALMPWAARRVGRPVKWTASRQECFTSDFHARDLASRAELALDGEGNFLALRGENILNLGAHTVYFWPLRKGLSMMQSVYRIPVVHFHGHAVLTHTTPTAVYRSAGRPEAIYMIERLIDLAAVECGFDRVALRRQNLIPKDALPYTNAVGTTYDSGDYPAALEDVLRRADWDGFEERKQHSAARGKYRGIAVSNYIEITSGFPTERVELSLSPGGHIDFVVGTANSGQGHETSFPQLVSAWLQIPQANIRFIANDSDLISVGGGSHSGRSMRLVSIAAEIAANELIAKGKAIAAQKFGVTESEISFQDGLFSAPGKPVLNFAGIAERAAKLNSLPSPLRSPVTGIGEVTNRVGGYPYGAHVCEVDVDPETGHVEIVAWTGIDDVGLAVHPAILHGQAHGAVLQGIGQALMEEIRFDPETGQLLSGSFMDYAMPRADTLPNLKTILSEVPAGSHPQGIRPGGEGGTTPALGLLINAIVHALTAHGVRHVEMPATPERVWQAIRQARQAVPNKGVQ